VTQPSVEDCRCYTGFKQFGEPLGNHRTTEIEALSLFTTSGLKESKLVLRFHTFRDDSLLETSPHVDYRADDGGIFAPRIDFLHERLVYLQGVDWKLTQITQAGITSTEIIDR
jgi:hypothetical protein